MRALTSSMTLPSRGLMPAVLTFGLGLAAVLSGCFVSGSNEPEPLPVTDPPVLDTPQQVAITPDKTLEFDAGKGVGIFVEYATGGRWHVWTSCDTDVTSVSCNFEVFAIPAQGADISNVQAEGLEAGDGAKELEDGVAHLSVSTSSDFDGMTFEATPGAVVELEVYFDGKADSRIVYWFGNDTLHTGAPTDPVDFLPDTP